MKTLNLLFIFLTVTVSAQVGIGTTTPEGALDISSTSQGVLLPRVSLTATNLSAPVINPNGTLSLATSTLVYNTNTSGVFPNSVEPGYYYWNGTKWVRLNTDSSWLVEGNKNTNPSVNFLGTLDDNDLVFKRNNVFSGRLSTTNTSFGVNAQSNPLNTTMRSVAFGVNALKNDSAGKDNVAIGYGTLENNTTGIQNIALGSSSLSLNTSGGYNVAIGYEAMARNTTGILNVAIGATSLYNNLSGRNNVAIGKSSLERNFSGMNNTAVGNNSLFNNQTGGDNVAFGKSALERNINGSYNIAIGSSSLFNNQTNSYSIAIGHESQTNNLSGSRNVSLGHQSLFANSSGYDNVALGYNAFYLGNFNNSIALGSNVVITADNQVRIGNSSTNSVGGFASWTNVSDKRFKTNIDYNKVPGLQFILKLKPVVYNLDLNSINSHLKIVGEKSEMNKTKLQTGFIAQEVEETAKEIGFDFSGVDKPKNEEDYYGLRYSEFVVPLTKAIQEQQEIIQSQQAEIDSLKQEFQNVLKILENMKNSK